MVANPDTSNSLPDTKYSLFFGVFSPVVSRRGYLNLLEPGASAWMKRWIVMRRPYVFIYNSHKDPVERGMFNLANTVVECSAQQNVMGQVRA